MKIFIKTVAITLCLSVTMLFLSSSKKVEAVATGTATLATAAVVAIGTLIVGVITYIASEMSVPAVKSYVNSSDFKDSISVDDDGTATYTASGSLPSSINAEVFNAAARKATSQYNSNLKMYICDSGRPDYGPPKIPSNSLDAAITGTLLGLIADASDDSNPFYKLKDYEETGDTSISTVDGKPQKVTTTESPTTVEIFDYLELSYHPYNNIFDIKLTFQRVEDIMANACYHRIYIIKDNILYVLSGDSSFESSGIFYSVFDSRKGSNVISFSGSFGEYLCANYYGNGGIDEHSRYITKLANVNGSLCLAFFNFHSGYNQYNNTWSNPSRFQYIFGYPSEPTVYPVLFNDTPIYDFTGSMSTTFKNYPISSPLLFVNPDNPDIRLSESDVLSGNYDSCGFIMSQNSTQVHGGTNGTLTTASRMMSGAQGNVVSGGTKTTYSDLSDLEKALYALAEQQGITYEQMLEQSNIVIENGEMYIEGLDGVQHSIDSLLSEFDNLLEQGDITNENIAASTEQLKAILEYLKSLNIEGLDNYIQQIESKLDGLEQGDKDREVVLRDILGQLTDLKTYLDSLGLSEISAEIKSISDNFSKLMDIEISAELDISETIDKFNTPDSITTKFPFSLPFDVYNIFNILSADPVAPQFEIPIDMTTLGGEVYKIDIDLSEYDFIANIVRWLLYGIFLIGLVLLTNRLIGRG